MPGYKCPYCGEPMPLDAFECFDVVMESAPRPLPLLTIEVCECRNEDCEEISVIGRCQNGFNRNRILHIIPERNVTRFPEYVPAFVRSDYEEASAILDKSPKASATLSRRCLQGMIRDFWGIKKNTLYEEIAELKGKIDLDLWSAIDSVRQIGNIGAHMQSDVNIVIDVEPHEAELLVSLIEQLITEWYIARHNRQKKIRDTVEIANRKRRLMRGSVSSADGTQ